MLRQPPVGPVLFLIGLVLVAFLVVVARVGQDGAGSGPAGAVDPQGRRSAVRWPGPDVRFAPRTPTATPGPTTTARPGARPPARQRLLPDGGRRVFHGQLLVAYYGTAGAPAMGVLGAGSPDAVWPRLLRATRAFDRPHHPAQPVYELVVSVATRGAGRRGNYSHDLSRSTVRRYLRAAHRHRALLVLDLQTGRSDFLTVARRWAWALRDPWVGLALDPEWRMGPRQVPGRRLGSVSATEVNRVSAWLAALVRRNGLPEKLFVLHQFRASMIHRVDRVRRRPALAMVQQVDGFGTVHQKLAAYHRLARPGRFRMGLKLFYHQDRRLMTPRRVLRIRPRVSFVSYQ